MDITKEQTTPDQLMASFKGRSLKSVIVFTILVHVVVVCGSSIPYFLKTLGAGASEGKESERLEAATKEATSAIRDIAKKHGVKAEELGERFAGTKPAKAVEPKAPAPEAAPETGTEPEPAKPESEIEKEIKIKEEGPKLPGIGSENEDLFK